MINGLYRVKYRAWIASFFVLSLIAQHSTAQDSLMTRISGNERKISVRNFIVPASLIGIGAVSSNERFVNSNAKIKEWRDEHFGGFHTKVDNYLQFAPIAAGYGILLAKPQHRFWPYTKKVILNEVLMMALVFPTKKLVGKPRPDSGAPTSFPSGHTAQAFSGATLFCDEFAGHNFWLKVTVYSGASAVGVLRVLNNRHWAGDVIAGAGFGILSAKLSEWIVEPRGRRSSKYPR
ncbi:MAG: phosphatase PAP2 family protein [Chitinophagaceae bacterium]